MSRLLSKADFGYFAAITGVMAILMSVSEAGLGSAVIQKKDASQSFISTAFTLSCIVGFVISTLLFCFSPYLAYLIADSTLTTPLRVMSINIFLYGIVSIGNGVLYRKLAFKTIGVINITSYAIASIVGITMAYYHCGVYSVVVLSVVHSLLNVLFLFVNVKFPTFSINREDTKGIVFFGGWLTAGVILNNISNQIDKLFLSKWLSVQALGSYNRPAGFVSSISTKINSIFDTVLFPILSDLQNDRDRVSAIFINSISLINIFSVLLAAVFFFNANLIISVFFGNNWLELTPVLQIVSISVIFNINGRLVDCFFRSLAYVRLGFVLRLLSVIITFVAIYIGSKYGIIGVATALVIANVTNIFIKLFSLAIKIKASPFEIIKRMILAWRVVVPIVVVGVPFLLLNNNSWWIIISFALVFVIIVLTEFVCFPRFVGDVYTLQVYPKVSRLVNKIVKR